MKSNLLHWQAGWRKPLVYMLWTFLLGSVLTGAFAQSAPDPAPLWEENQLNKQYTSFPDLPLFASQTQPVSRDPELGEVLEDGLQITLNDKAIQSFFTLRPQHFTLTLPHPKNEAPLLLELSPSSIFADGFQIFTATQSNIAAVAFTGLHYRGVLQGDSHSVVSLSVFPDEVMATISTTETTYTLGKRKDDHSGRHLLYDTRDLKPTPSSSCWTNENHQLHPMSQPDEQGARGADQLPCVRMYLEANYDIFQEKGGLDATAAFVTGLFNQSAVLFFNEEIIVKLSELMIWDTLSPYKGPTAGDYLDNFMDFQGGFNGDIGQLLSFESLGGIAFVDVLCKTDFDVRKAYSGVTPYYQDVPVYSWSINVFTHEAGHLLGSPHTHECKWNGNNTPLDGCFDPGNDCDNNLGLPTGGGTIMSYCHLTSVGVNFSKGFGEQPGDLIRSRIAQAACLSSCDGPDPDPLSYCETKGKNVAFEFIQRVKLNDLDHTSTADGGYADFSTSLTANLQSGESYLIELEPGFTYTAYHEYWRVWIDFNLDGEFSPDDELVFEADGAGPVSGSLQIPPGLDTLKTRMRVAMKYGSYPDPCEEFLYGEVEDYGLQIGGDPNGGSGVDCPQGLIKVIGNGNGSISSGVYKSEDEVQSAGTVESGNSIEFVAGKSITLEVGFEVKSGSEMLGIIGPCNTAVPLPPTGQSSQGGKTPEKNN